MKYDFQTIPEVYSVYIEYFRSLFFKTSLHRDVPQTYHFIKKNGNK